MRIKPILFIRFPLSASHELVSYKQRELDEEGRLDTHDKKERGSDKMGAFFLFAALLS